MNLEEKYPNKDINELSHLFFELSNEHLVPALNEHLMIGLAKFKSIQENEPDLQDIIIVADFDENIFVFATGVGEELVSKEDDTVFYIAKDGRFTECMELLNEICFGTHPNGHLNLDSEVYHWIDDASYKLEEDERLVDMNLTIWGNYFYGESEVDPMLEVFNS